MKKIIITCLVVAVSISARAQNSSFTISGGYSFANIEEVEENATGFRINGLYEINPNEGKVAQGFAVGYIGLSADAMDDGSSVEYKVTSWPVYYAPKVLFGEGSFKAFVKGALGMQFSSTKRTSSVGGEIKANDAGFYGGLGAGFMKNLGEKMFLNVEYEWAYMSNSVYRDGFMNSVMGGIGFKF